jgi:hypothetical protein
MKAFLMHRARDFDVAQAPPPFVEDLVQDLGLEGLFKAMAGDDPFLRQIAKTALLGSLRNVEEIRYRQEILRDCLANPAVVRGIYDLAVAAVEGERKHYWGLLSRYPGAILNRAVNVLRSFVALLRRLRQVAEIEEEKFQSEGFRSLFAMLQRELAEDYLNVVAGHIEQLKFRRGPTISARPGNGIAGTDYVLRRPNRDDRSMMQRLVCRRPSYTFRIAERDEAGARAVSELRDRGISIVDRLSADGIVLFNESLQSTNEREGSEIGRQIVRALVESRVKVFIVTHMYDLARGLRVAGIGSAAFLRAERLEDGTRTLRIIPGAPLPTSYGKDLYRQIFCGPGEEPGVGNGYETDRRREAGGEAAQAQ